MASPECFQTRCPGEHLLGTEAVSTRKKKKKIIQAVIRGPCLFGNSMNCRGGVIGVGGVWGSTGCTAAWRSSASPPKPVHPTCQWQKKRTLPVDFRSGQGCQGLLKRATAPRSARPTFAPESNPCAIFIYSSLCGVLSLNQCSKC